MKPESADEKNVMPSMVVRQQRILMGQISANPRASQLGSSTAASISAKLRPESIQSSSSIPLGSMLACDSSSATSSQQPLFDQDGLVVPKKILQHPNSAHAQPMFKDLNRELKFNQVRGKNVLEQKSELKRVMEKIEEGKRRREAEQERLNRRTSLELRLDERAQRLANESAKAPDSASSAGANFAGIKSTMTR